MFPKLVQGFTKDIYKILFFALFNLSTIILGISNINIEDYSSSLYSIFAGGLISNSLMAILIKKD